MTPMSIVRHLCALPLAATLIVLMPLDIGAAEAVFPPASRIGLAPPAGMLPSKVFQGFEDREKKTAILFAELPGEAFDDIEKGFTAEALKGQGVTMEAREDLPIKDGKAFVVIGRQDIAGIAVRKWIAVARANDLTALVTVQVPETSKEAYADKEVRAALATLVVRASVPVEEQLAVLPFSIGSLGGFRIVRVLTGSVALLTEGPNNAVEFAEQPMFLIATSIGSPIDAPDRERFARQAIARTPGLKNMRVVRSEPLRITGQHGYEILVEAKDQKTETDITMVQWLRFGAGGYIRMIGIARKDRWASLFPRFREVRDGIEPR